MYRPCFSSVSPITRVSSSAEGEEPQVDHTGEAVQGRVRDADLQACVCSEIVQVRLCKDSCTGENVHDEPQVTVAFCSESS
jgi:hypothetical protein